MKKVLALILMLSLVLSLTACGANPSAQPGGNPGGSGQQTDQPPVGNAGDEKIGVGIAMPTQSSSRWISDGGTMKSILESAGYEVDLQFAEDSVEAQVSQIENMISKGVKVLVIAAIDGQSLTNVLSQAARENISVIAYDRLIRDTGDVSYHVTFDNFLVGVHMASYIVKALDVDNQPGPFNVELFAGSPDDNNAYFVYDGSMSVLQPYIDSGKLVVKSGQIGMEKVSTLRWDGATAQQRMDNIIAAHYSDADVDAVLSPYDGISIGIISSLKSVGYGSGGKKMPIVPGQDAEIPSIKSILAGEQAMTIFKDTRTLAEKAVTMIEALLKGTEPEINDTSSYDNGVKIVPSYLCDMVVVDINNVEQALVDTGYYTKADIGM